MNDEATYEKQIELLKEERRTLLDALTERNERIRTLEATANVTSGIKAEGSVTQGGKS